MTQNLRRSSLVSASNPSVFEDDKKVAPKIHKIHRGLAAKKPSVDLPVSKNYNDSARSLTGNEKPSNFKRLSLPQIDILKGRDDFAISSIRSLKNEWFATNVNNSIGGSKIVVRKKDCDKICHKIDAASEDVRLRRRRIWIRNIWQRAIRKVIMERRRTRKRIYLFWKNASEKLLRLNYERKEQSVEDRFKFLSHEFERLMISEDWRTIQKKEYDLDQMMKRIDHRYKQKVMDQLRKQMVSNMWSSVYHTILGFPKLFWKLP